MAAERRIFHIRADSDLAKALQDATNAREPLYVSAGDVVFEVHVHSTESLESFSRDKPYSILDIVGLGDSGEPSNIAEHKDEYIADAYDYKRQ